MLGALSVHELGLQLRPATHREAPVMSASWWFCTDNVFICCLSFTNALFHFLVLRFQSLEVSLQYGKEQAAL